jgi:hypothetical protein
VCAVFNATRPDERIVSGTLATIGPLVQATDARGPCLLLMGRALRAIAQSDREPATSSPSVIPVLACTGEGRCHQDPSCRFLRSELMAGYRGQAPA